MLGKVTLTDLNGNEYEKEVEEAGGLERTRDLFCFCAFTSLRYSDMAELRRSNIDGNIMHITTQKMNNHLKNLCELCGINSPVTETCIRNGRRETQVYPKYAKIGTHAGRRSFICFALSSGIPPIILQN